MNAGSGDTIELEAGDYSTVASNGSAPFVVGTSVTIEADPNNTAPVYLDGANTTSVVTVASGVTATIGGVTIENGSSSASTSGGALTNAGTLTISDSTVEGNTAQYGAGGVLNNGTLTVTDSAFIDNSAGSSGGAVRNGGTFTSAASTFIGNAAGSGGGAIDNFSSLSVSTVTSSTIVAVAGQFGGVITAANGTFTEAGDVITGACVLVAVTDDGYNVVASATCDSSAATDVVDSSLASELAASASNGGSTETVALEPGNPAIESILNFTTVGSSPSFTLCPTTDQRGISSPNGLSCDAGAAQLQLDSQSIIFTTSPPSGATYTGTNYSHYDVAATGGASGNAVTFTVDPSSTSGCTISSAAIVQYGSSPGTCVIDANQAGTAGGTTEYEPAQNQQTFSITATIPTAPDVYATPGVGSATVNWDSPSSDGGEAITGYNVFEGTEAGGESSSPVNSSPITPAATSYVVGGLTNGTRYYFTIEAVNSVGSSPASSEVSALPMGGPGAPTNVTATQEGPTSISLSWSAPADNGGAPLAAYAIYRSTTPTFTGTQIAGVSGTSYTDADLSASTTYYYWIGDNNGFYDSPPSSVATATTEAATVTPPPTARVPVVTGISARYGTAGTTTVTIRGYGFELGNRAYFGKVPATTRVIDDGSAVEAVEAVVPIGQGTVLVRVANNVGVRSAAGFRFIYLPKMGIEVVRATSRGVVVSVRCVVGPCHLVAPQFGQITYGNLKSGGVTWRLLAQRSHANLRTDQTRTFLLSFDKAGITTLSINSRVRRVNAIVDLNDRLLGVEVLGVTLVHSRVGAHWQIRSVVSPAWGRWSAPR